MLTIWSVLLKFIAGISPCNQWIFVKINDLCRITLYPCGNTDIESAPKILIPTEASKRKKHDRHHQAHPHDATIPCG